MTLEEAIRDIASHEFAARVGVASGFDSFLRVLRGQEAVQVALHEMAGDTPLASRRRVLLEVFRLSRLQVDYRYENPWDSALAALLWTLSSLDPQLAGLAAEVVVQAPQCWWAARVAHEVLEQAPIRDTGTVAQSESVPFRDVPGPGTAKSHTGDTYLWSRLVWSVRDLDLWAGGPPRTDQPLEPGAPPVDTVLYSLATVDLANRHAVAP